MFLAFAFVPTILLIEDDRLMSDLYETILVSGGFTVQVLTAGREALETAKKIQPEVIILDLMMPDMSGMDVLVSLKGEEKTRGIPVIMFSNLLEPELAKEAEAKGAARYAIKIDFKPGRFLEMVKEVIATLPKPSAPQMGLGPIKQ